MPRATPESLSPFEQVFRVIRRIPKKRVATYGQISKLIEGRLSPLGVSWAVHAACLANRADVPWQRVVSANGDVGAQTTHGKEQRKLLLSDGVVIQRGSVDLDRYGWRPR